MPPVPPPKPHMEISTDTKSVKTIEIKDGEVVAELQLEDEKYVKLIYKSPRFNLELYRYDEIQQFIDIITTLSKN